MIKLTLLFSLLLILTNCTSAYKKISKTPFGTTKRQALYRLGEPVEKYRKKGMDHWIYESVKSSKKSNKILFKHTLVFNDGVLTKNFFERSFTKKEMSEFLNEK